MTGSSLVKRTEAGLWIAPNFGFLRHRKRSKTVTLPNGERAKITVDDSGIVEQVEHGEVLDGTVRPKPILMELKPRLIAPYGGGNARVRSIMAGIRVKK
jgi:hypothetical protein